MATNTHINFIPRYVDIANGSLQGALLLSFLVQKRDRREESRYSNQELADKLGLTLGVIRHTRNILTKLELIETKYQKQGSGGTLWRVKNKNLLAAEVRRQKAESNIAKSSHQAESNIAKSSLLEKRDIYISNNTSKNLSNNLKANLDNTNNNSYTPEKTFFSGGEKELRLATSNLIAFYCREIEKHRNFKPRINRTKDAGIFKNLLKSFSEDQLKLAIFKFVKKNDSWLKEGAWSVAQLNYQINSLIYDEASDKNASLKPDRMKVRI